MNCHALRGGTNAPLILYAFDQFAKTVTPETVIAMCAELERLSAILELRGRETEALAKGDLLLSDVYALQQRLASV
jgi:hypothetical protein